MSFQPVVPMGGYSGWRFLQSTLPRQQEAFRQAPASQRAADHFRENIAKAKTAADLVGDRRLLEVALGAFGLEADINSRAYIQRVLEDGTTKPGALANRLADKRYVAFAQAFGYGNGLPHTRLPSFANDIVTRWEGQAFQKAVGEQDETMRLALNLAPALREVTGRSANVNAQWYAIMGEPPLRQVFQTALGLPKSFGAIDIDQQLVAFKDRAEATFGTSIPAELLEPARQDKLMRLFLLRSDAQSQAVSPAAMALQLLRR